MSQIGKSVIYAAAVLRVADMKRALAFYCDALGFTVEFVHAGFYASIVRDGCRIHLKHGPSIERDNATLEAGEHIDVCCGVVDARVLVAQWQAFVSLPLRAMPYGLEFHVRDPDGNVLGYVQADVDLGASAPGGEVGSGVAGNQREGDAGSNKAREFTNQSLVASRFENVNLANSSITDANMAQCSFRNVSLAGACFADINFSNATIVDANLEGMCIDGILVTELLAMRGGRLS